jgi:AAA domain
MPEVQEVSALQLRLAEAEAQATTMDVVDLADMVDADGPVGWLIESLWPADAYGAIAAKDKAGKTWVATDLAVSVATGTPWLGHFECEPGPVIMYCGEGGARNIVRRVRAVAEHKGVAFRSLGGRFHVSEVAPRFKSVKALEQMETEVRLHGPRLVIVDPLYLAAAVGRAPTCTPWARCCPVPNASARRTVLRCL